MYLLLTPKNGPLTKSQLVNYGVTLSTIVIFLASISIFFLDVELTLLFKEDDWKWVFAREITNIGLFTNYFIPAFIVWFSSYILLNWKKNFFPIERVKRVSMLASWMMYCLLFSGLCTHIIKPLVGRQRPKISPSFDPHVFQPFITHWDFHSMPSGHSQVLFTVATFTAFLFPRFKYGIYFMAFAFSFTRVMTRDHFYSDVLMGALVGHLSTAFLLYWLSRRQTQKIPN